MSLPSIVDELNSLLPGMEREIHASVVTLVCGESLLLVGPPGTAKTRLIDLLSEKIRGRCFRILLSPYTEPDELLGPVDIQKYREGKFSRRVDGYLPTAHIVFLDEIFRASSAVRTLLLDVMMYKRVKMDGADVRIPVLAIYTASNEVSREREDSAFSDRLLLRVFQEEDGTDRELLARVIRAGIRLEDRRLQPSLTPEDVELVQRRCVSLAQEVPDYVVSKEVDAIVRLKEKGVRLSRRRAVKTLKVASAIAMLNQRDRITSQDLREALAYTAPLFPEQVPAVREALEDCFRMSERAEALRMEIMEEVERAKTRSKDFALLGEFLMRKAEEAGKLEDSEEREEILALIEGLAREWRKRVQNLGQ